MRILMITASAGNGHNSTAKRLKEQFLEKEPNIEIEIVDMYKCYAPKLTAWSIEGGYFLVCNKLVGAYNYFFRKSEKSTFENRYKTYANKNVYSMLYGLLNKIYEYKPDLIICTYIFGAIAMANLKRAYNIPAKIACMTLDYGVSPYWECTGDALDYMFITDDYMIEPFINRGFKRENLYSVGIPVSSKFSLLNNREETLKKLGLNKDLTTVIIMKSGFFPISERAIIKNLKKVTTKLQIVIINGTDKKSKKKFDKILKKERLIHDIYNLGFVEVLDYFSVADLIIGKGGAHTTTESLTAMIPSLIVDKIPQQEIYNKEYLINNGCALAINKKNLASVLQNLVDNKEELVKMKENCKKIRKTFVIEKFYEVLKDVPKADYSNVEKLQDNKRTVIKKVDKRRKELNKEQKGKNLCKFKKLNNI